MPGKRISISEQEGMTEIDGGLALKLEKFPVGAKKLLDKVGNEPVKKIVIFRKPLGGILTKTLNKLTKGALDNFLKTAPYDKFFHLGIIINDKYLMDKQDSFTFKKVNAQKFLRTKGMETRVPTVNYQGLTIKTLVDKTKAKMGDSKFFGYQPLTNNCQDFIIALLDSINAKFDRPFVKQKVEQLAKTVPTWKQKIAEFLVAIPRTAKRVKVAKGIDVVEAKMLEKHDKFHSDEHMKKMRELMEQGVSFEKAHKEATRIVGMGAIPKPKVIKEKVIKFTKKEVAKAKPTIEKVKAKAKKEGIIGRSVHIM
jgi:hypothetical protein|tara:strand:- start:1353 stop:2282 length:930 start_codon:yes stop_codon:yes gene_type:complete